MTRHQDTLDALEAADAFAAERGIPRAAGWYSGQWYVDSYLAGWMPPGRYRWWAAYNGQAGSLLVTDDVVAHQWTSTPVDQSVLFDAEIIDYGSDGGDVSDDERAQMQKTIDGLIVTIADIADRLGDQLLAETQRASMRKSIIRQIVAQMEAERTNAVGPRPTSKGGSG